MNICVDVLNFMVKGAEAKVRQSRRKHRANQHWFDEECFDRKQKSRETLRALKENNEVSRIKYWESRKQYGSIIEKEAWQTKEAEHVDVAVGHKEAKKI